MLARTELKTPERRECERCGRHEVWDDSTGWRIVTENSANGQPNENGEDRTVGNSHCIHEWDIDGAFSPYK